MTTDIVAMRPRYEFEETEVLLRILNFDQEKYTDQALEAARDVLRERGIDTQGGPELDKVRNDVETEAKQTLEF
jgi:hypothetical protein